MAKINLTDAFVKSAKCKPTKDGRIVTTDYPDQKEAGLALRVTPANVKSWTYRYRTKHEGKQKRIAIGKTDNVPLSEARAEAARFRVSVHDGGDPALESAQARFVAKDRLNKDTVLQVGEWYFKECVKGRHHPKRTRPKRESTMRNEKYHFDTVIVPALGRFKLSELSRAQIQSFINDLADQRSIGTAQKCHVVLHAIYVFGLMHEIIDHNPCQMVVAAKHPERDRVLTDAELKAAWEALLPPVQIEGASITANVACSILIAITTLQRRGEIMGMQLNELDRDKMLWNIPASRTKNHRSHIVPLSELTLELIDLALSVRTGSSDYVFESPRAIGCPALPAAMTRGFGRVRKALELTDMRVHDFRRTGSTNLTGEGGLGFNRFIVSRVLNHAGDTGGASATTGRYDKNDYLPEKRRALDAWALRLRDIVADQKQTSNVVKMIAKS